MPSKFTVRMPTEFAYPRPKVNIWRDVFFGIGGSPVRRKWFKHFVTSSQGASLRGLLLNKDYEAYALFWVLLELMGRFEDENNPGVMNTNWNTIGWEMGWKPTKTRRVLLRICSVSQIEMKEKQSGNVSFLIPKWVELQSSWGGKREARFSSCSGDVRSKKLEVRSKNNTIAQTAENPARPKGARALFFDLEVAYQKYPRKEGKSRGMKLLKPQIKTEEDYQQLLVAIDRYSKSKPVGDGFVKHFSTFVGEWRDWLDPETGTSIASDPTSHIDWSRFT